MRKTQFPDKIEHHRIGGEHQMVEAVPDYILPLKAAAEPAYPFLLF
jgi:hypothetical protein